MRSWVAAGVLIAAVVAAPRGAQAQAPPPQASFEVGMVTARETDADVRVGVVLSEADDETLRVDWSAGPPHMIADAASALEGRDYAGGRGTLEFAPGDTREEIVLDLLDDGIYEGGVMLALTLGSGGPSGPFAVVDIRDDETQPPVSIGDATVRESAGAATLRVARPWPSTFAERYGWATVAGSAAAGADFAARTGEVGVFQLATVPPELQVPIEDDALGEPDETFEVRLATLPPLSPWGGMTGRIADGVATITIVDDDPPSAPLLTAAVARGRVIVRQPGGRRQRLAGDVPVQRGALLDARGGAVLVRYAGGSATLAGGVVKVRAADRLALAGGSLVRCRLGSARVLRRLAVAADPGLVVTGRRAATSAVGGRARWRIADRCDGTRVDVRAGRVVAAGRDLRAGQRRLYR